MSEQDSNFRFQIRRMLESDLSDIALLHSQIFPDYFLTHMGIRFLEKFYAGFVEQASTYGNVAVHDGKLVGFVVGTTDSSRFFGRFYQKNFLTSISTIVVRFFLNPDLRKEIVYRLPHISYAIRSLFYGLIGKSSVGKMKTPSTVSTRLLSIGVLPEFRGQHVADQLVHHFCQQLCNDGIDTVGLSVQLNNTRAIAFYEKTGWRREHSTETGIYFTNTTHPGSL